MFTNSPQFIKPLDFLIAPLLISGILVLAFFYSNWKYNNLSIRRYFIYGLIIKLFGSIVISLTIQYYYGFGDAYYYHKGATDLNELYFLTIPKTIKILWNDSSYIISLGFDISNFCKACTTSKFGLETSFLMMKIGGIIGFFSQNTFIGTSLIFSLFSFMGSWKIFQVFSHLYPEKADQLAISFLAIPSVVFWGSGFTKESIVMGTLGFLFYNAYKVFIKKTNIILNVTSLFVNGYLLLMLKVHIFISLVSSLLLWISFYYISKSILSTQKKILLIGSVLLLTSSFSFFTYNKITTTKTFKSFSKEKIFKKIASMRESYQPSKHAENKTSYFETNTIEPSLIGLVKKIPNSLRDTFFRPYIWEVNKVIYLPAALENSFLILFTLYVIISINILHFLKDIFNQPVLFFCLSFCLLLGTIIGLTTANFGTLTRYRIPFLPFYLAALIIINNIYSRKNSHS